MRDRDLFELELNKFARKSLPITCHFDLTYHCNLNCIHCYIVENSIPELKTKEVKNILKELASAGILFLKFSGGEILCREDFFEIADYARKLHFSVDFITNGTLIDEELADKISALHPFKVSISIYSTDPRVHDGITGVRGSLDNSMKAVKLLREKNLWVNILDVVMQQNINDYFQVFEFAKKWGSHFKLDTQVTPKINGDNSPVKFQVDDDDIFKLRMDRIVRGLDEEDLNDLENPASDLDSFIRDIPCSAAHNFFYISPYGDVFPCVQFPIYCGNLKIESFKWIWNHSLNMLKVRSIRLSRLSGCSTCDDLNYCHFCPGLAYVEGGDMESSYPRACQDSMINRKIRELK